jgi:hypothetical protein
LLDKGVVVLKQLAVLFTAVLLLGGLASLQACPDEKESIKITLVVILASEEGDKIDPRLKAIAAEIQKLNPNLKSFCLKTMQSKSLKPGDKVSWPLVDDKEAQMLVKHGANQDNRVSLAVTAPSMGEIEYQTVCGKFLPIVTRYQTKNRERLILAIRVQPCRGE